MQNIWVISGGHLGRSATFEYHATEEAAYARAEVLAAEARREFEALDERVGLGVRWEQYQEIHDLAPYEVLVLPHTDSQNPYDDHIEPIGEAPTERVWVVLEDGRPEEERGYALTEEGARSMAWDRNWAVWEYYGRSVEAARGMPFAEYKAAKVSGPYDYAPVDPGPERP